MKYLKCFIMLIMIIMLSGCKVTSSVIVNYDGTVNENVEVLDKTSLMGNSKSDIESYVNAGIDSFKDVLDLRKYKTSVIYDKDSKSGAKVTNNYSNVCEYVQRNLFSQYVYGNVSCTDDGGYYIIKNETPHINYCGDCNDWPALDDVELKITLPVSASENNADDVDGNTYVWRYDKNTPEYKSLYLKINKDSLQDNKEKVIEKEKTKKTISIAVGVIIALAVVGGMIFIGLMLYKKYKANKLDY